MIKAIHEAFIFKQVAIDIEGDRNGRVPQLGLNILGMGANGNEVGGAGVPQVVEAEAGGEGHEGFVEPGGGGSASVPGNDAAMGISAWQACKRGDDRGGQIDDAELMVFRGGLGPIDGGVADAGGVLGQGEICPAQAQDFPTPEAGAHAQQNGGVEHGIGGLGAGEQVGDLRIG